jgi:hypothetical protein
MFLQGKELFQPLSVNYCTITLIPVNEVGKGVTNHSWWRRARSSLVSKGTCRELAGKVEELTVQRSDEVVPAVGHGERTEAERNSIPPLGERPEDGLTIQQERTPRDGEMLPDALRVAAPTKATNNVFQQFLVRCRDGVPGVEGAGAIHGAGAESVAGFFGHGED